MKIALFGADCFTCQLPRIKDAFIHLNHEINYDNPDIIYANDPGGFKQALELKNKSNGFLILNILDIPWCLPEVQTYIKNWSALLNQADAITAISKKVSKDLQPFVNKAVNVIFNPTKDVHYDSSVKKNNLFMYVGRANDPNKRINLVYQTLSHIENGVNSIKICGSENPYFGQYLGVIPDQDLNMLYNSTKYVFLPSKIEGIGLSMIEGMICGCIPITCEDNETAIEFSPKDFICQPNPQSILQKIVQLNSNYDYYHTLALNYGEIYKEQFNKITIAKNILNIYNINI